VIEGHRPRVDRTVLVTGSAGAIGRATTGRFLELGMTVLGIDRVAQADDEGADARHRHVTVDLEDAESTEAQIQAALADLPPLAHVVGIAGGALPFEPGSQHEPERITHAQFRESLEANLTTQFTIVRACLGFLGAAPDEDRSITLTSSFNALSAQGMPAYSAAKAGIIGLMHALVIPLGNRGIRINVVAPGTVRTPRTERLWAGTPDHFARLEDGAALGRLAQPADVAEAFVALAVHLRHVSGHVLVVDGGQSVVHR
jgi:NAD(P)-dependent dehydrogenase (short-subunit alcohol dehydrogenase family)